MSLLKVICSSAEFDKKVWGEDRAGIVCSVLLLAPGKSGYRQYYATIKSTIFQRKLKSKSYGTLEAIFFLKG